MTPLYRCSEYVYLSYLINNGWHEVPVRDDANYIMKTAIYKYVGESINGYKYKLEKIE